MDGAPADYLRGRSRWSSRATAGRALTFGRRSPSRRDNGGDLGETAAYTGDSPRAHTGRRCLDYAAHPQEIDEQIELQSTVRRTMPTPPSLPPGKLLGRLRLLLDEMLSPAIARELRGTRPRRRGHPGAPGVVFFTSDPEVLDLAREEHRALVTDNLVNMRPLHYEAIAPGGPAAARQNLIPGGLPPYPRRHRQDRHRVRAQARGASRRE